jgi:GT2 family glycosyltransferase
MISLSLVQQPETVSRHFAPALASVIVNTRDRAASLAVALAHLQAQDYANLEVIVVDNDSHDSTPIVARAYGVRYVHMPSRYGIGACRARGVDAALGSVIAFLDDDCVPESGWLSAFVRRFNADPSVGLLGGQVDNVGFTGRKVNKGRSRHARNGLLEFVENGEDADFFGNMNLAVRRDAIDDVGNYDPFYNVMEEIDLAARMRARGYRVAYEPAARVQHHHRSAFFKHRHVFRGQQLIRLQFFLTHYTPRTLDQWLDFASAEVRFMWHDLVHDSRYLAWVIVKRKWDQLPNAPIRFFNTISARLAIPWLCIRARGRKINRP